MSVEAMRKELMNYADAASKACDRWRTGGKTQPLLNEFATALNRCRASYNYFAKDMAVISATTRSGAMDNASLAAMNRAFDRVGDAHFSWHLVDELIRDLGAAMRGQ